jgi:hypothetical protein
MSVRMLLDVRKVGLHPPSDECRIFMSSVKLNVVMVSVVYVCVECRCASLVDEIFTVNFLHGHPSQFCQRTKAPSLSQEKANLVQAHFLPTFADVTGRLWVVFPDPILLSIMRIHV